MDERSEIERERAIQRRATSTSQELRAVARSMPPSEGRSLREGMANSTDLSLLLLERMTNIKSDISELKERVGRIEKVEQRAVDVLMDDRRSKIGLEEEITRTDLYLKKDKFKLRREVITRAVAVIMTPPALWALWGWVKNLLH